MVVSKINPSITYAEVKKVDSEDSKKQKELYVIDLENDDIPNISLIIAIGGAKMKYDTDGVVYFPVYLVKKNKKVMQIGVYEINTDDMDNFLDKKGNLVAEHADGPLVYSFVTREMLKTVRLDPRTVRENSDSEDSDEDDEDEKSELIAYKKSGDVEIPPYRADIFITIKGIPIPGTLKEETRKDARDAKDKYKKQKSDNWINIFMTNSYYYLIDNEGSGDCLFSAIRDSYAQIGQQTSVAKIRKKLADEADDDLFLNYKDNYDMAVQSISHDTTKIKQLEIEYEKFKSKYEGTIDREERKKLSEAGSKISNERDLVINEKRVSQEIMKEFKFMKKISTLDQFKKLIQTCSFWGETWALSTLERILNVKFILLSHEAYKDKDVRNVLNCGQMNDSVLELRGRFEPEFYIMLEYNGSHYRLIGYKKKQIFDFKELPYDIKKMIVDKCMERDSGAFSLIPEFIRFKDELKTSFSTSEKFDELSEAKIRNLYDEKIELRFYNQSSSKRMPGKGAGEKISPQERARDFSNLATIPDWRKKLDNMWQQEFTLDGYRWNSVEHFIQASKFKNDNRDFYLSFTLESGTELSKNAEQAKGAGSKTGNFKKEKIRPKEVEPDEDYTEEKITKNLKKALNAKFEQNKDLKALLLATKNAKLVHSEKSKDPIMAEELMIVRNELQ